ncbi:MAG TPA: VCBS repeat-containing protein, partial [Polyangiaceae bacterium]
STGKKSIAIYKDGRLQIDWRNWHMKFCSSAGDELLTADLDGNRWTDMVCHNKDSGLISTWLSGSSPHNDYNFDGYPDVVWYKRTASGISFSVWLLNRSTHLSQTIPDMPVGPSGLLGVPSGWAVRGTADFNRDGNTDFLWHNGETGEVAVWFMSGPTRLAASVPDALIGPTRKAIDGWTIAGIGDFDRSGTADLLWYNTSSGRLQVWHLDGTNHIGSDPEIGPANTSTLYPSSGWTLRGTADFDRDGFADLLWQHTDGTLAVWFLNGTNHLPRDIVLSAALPAGWQVRGTDDFNRDGNADILLYDPASGVMKIRFYDHTLFTGEETVGPNATLAEGADGWQLLPR